MRRGRRRHTPSKWITVLLFVLFAMGIGYAAISTTLTIDGTSDIDSASWDVHFENIQVTSGSVTASTPTITDDTTVSFSATLANPGDFYEFTVDLVNDGTLNALIYQVNILPQLTINQQKTFNYLVAFNDGQAIEEGFVLRAGETKTIIIKVEYKHTTDPYALLTDDVSYDFSVSLNTSQASVSNTNGTFYSSDSHTAFPNAMISDIYGTKSNALDTKISRFDVSPLIKYTVTNGLVTSSQLGFIYNNNVYYLTGGGATLVSNYDGNNSWVNYVALDDSPYYVTNKNTLLNTLGSSRCDNYDDSFISCSYGNTTIYANRSGLVSVSIECDYGCNINSAKIAECTFAFCT